MAEKNIDLQDISLLGQLYDQFLKLLNLSDREFKLVYPFMQWIWPDSPPGYINPNVFAIVDTMPDSGWFYTSSGTGVYNGYKNLLAVAPKLSIDYDEELEKAQKKVSSAWDHLKATEKEVRDAWIKAYSKDPSIIYNEWVSTSIEVKNNKEALDQFDEAITEKIKAIEGVNEDYTEALNACKKPSTMESSKPGFVKSDDEGIEMWYPSYEINNGKGWGGLKADGNSPKLLSSSSGVLKLKLGSNLQTSPPAESDTTPSTVHNNAWVESAALALQMPHTFNKDFKPGDTLSFFATRDTDGIWQAFDIVKDQHFDVSLEVHKFKFVPVQPGVWYNGIYLQELAEGDQWNHPFTTKAPPSAVFGEDGILSCRITEIIAGCHVKFSISLSSDTYHQHVQEFLTTSSIRIGPFRFGPEKEKGEMAWIKHTEDDNCVLHGETASDDWFVLGFKAVSPGM